MRDPNRIKKILSTLERLWTKYPDMRLGQLIVGATSHALDSMEGPHYDPSFACPEIFYLEDQDMEIGLLMFPKMGEKE